MYVKTSMCKRACISLSLSLSLKINSRIFLHKHRTVCGPFALTWTAAGPCPGCRCWRRRSLKSPFQDLHKVLKWWDPSNLSKPPCWGIFGWLGNAWAGFSHPTWLLVRSVVKSSCHHIVRVRPCHFRKKNSLYVSSVQTFDSTLGHFRSFFDIFSYLPTFSNGIQRHDLLGDIFR